MHLNREEKERYSRHLMLDQFGETAQLKLKNASVLVVGAGGLGCPALLYLAAAGVGHLGIADDDRVSLSNLQRQVLFDTADVGRLKCEVAEEKLRAKNPNLHISSLPSRITPENVLEIIHRYNVVLDASDNLDTRYLINDACVILKKPMVYGALYKFEGQVSTFNYQEGPTYRCLFPESASNTPLKGCGEIGVLGVLPGIIGTYQAAEAIKIVTGIGAPLSGRLLVINLLNNEQSVMKFPSNQANKSIKALGDYKLSCIHDSASVDAPLLRSWLADSKIQLLDVREKDEFERFNIGGINLPLSTLESKMTEIDPLKKTVIICQSGIRSTKALQMIRSKFPSILIFNLAGGLSQYPF